MTNSVKSESVSTFWTKLEDIWLLIVWLFFGLTVLMRLVNLANIPITEGEANLALITTRGQAGAASELPIYTGLTSILFYIFGNANFWSRIIPIATGSSLIFLPGLWRDRLEFKKVFLLSAAFMLIPTITYFSRTIASPVFATAALLWLISLIRLRRWAWAGVAAGCLWLSGSFALPISILALIGFVIARSGTSNVAQFVQLLRVEKSDLIRFSSALLVTLVMVSTSVFINHAGFGDIGSFFTASVDVFRNWQPSELIRFAFVLLQYNLIPLILFICSWIGHGSGSEETRTRRVVCLTVASLSLILSLFNVGFLLPFSIIIWTMGIADFRRQEDPIGQKRRAYLPLLVFGVALLIYVSIVTKTWATASYNAATLGLAVIAGVLLFALAHGFVGMGWSASLSKRTSLISVSVILLAGMLSGTIRLVLAEPEKSALHWQNSPVYSDTVLTTLLSEFRKMANFDAGELVIRADTSPNAPYEWITRSQTGLNDLHQSGLPQVVITTTDKPGSNIETNYRGMSFAGAEEIDWKIVNLKSFIAGVFGTDLPIIKTFDYLWVEKSYFSGN